MPYGVAAFVCSLELSLMLHSGCGCIPTPIWRRVSFSQHRVCICDMVCCHHVTRGWVWSGGGFCSLVGALGLVCRGGRCPSSRHVC